MLTTVLKGNLAIGQSKALIRIFKGMKDYSYVASRIQGITVEIGGDTTKLSTVLSKNQ